jgi:hypothetical protein
MLNSRIKNIKNILAAIFFLFVMSLSSTSAIAKDNFSTLLSWAKIARKASSTGEKLNIPHQYQDEKGNHTDYCNTSTSGDSPQPQTSLPFGLWNLNEFLKSHENIFLVIDKHDALNLWKVRENALALGSVNNWHDNNIHILEQFKKVIALIPPDSEGKKFLHCLKKIVPLRDKIKVVELGPYKTFSDLTSSLWQKNIAPFENKGNIEEELDEFIDEGISLDDKAIRLSTPTDHKTGEKRNIFTHGKYETWVLENDKRTKKAVEDVLEGIKTNPDDKSLMVIPSATLEDYAIKKLIPIHALRQAGFKNGIYNHKVFGPVHGVKMFSFLSNQKPLYFRYRISMDSSQPSTARFPKILFKPNGHIFSKDPYQHQLTIYGLEDLEDYENNGRVILVEGESDRTSLAFNGLPSLGVPGTQTWNPEWNRLLAGIKTIYVTVENDEGGDHFLETVHNNAFRNNVVLIDFTTEPDSPYADLKDPSDLHVGVYTDIGRKFLSSSLIAQLDQEKNGKILVQKEILGLMKNGDSSFIKQGKEVYNEQMEYILKKGIPWKDFEPSLKKYLEDNADFYQQRRQEFDRLNDELTKRRLENYELYKLAQNPELTPDLEDKKRMLSEWSRINDEQNAEHKALIKKYLPTPFLDYYNITRGRITQDEIKAGGKRSTP